MNTFFVYRKSNSTVQRRLSILQDRKDRNTLTWNDVNEAKATAKRLKVDAQAKKKSRSAEATAFYIGQFNRYWKQLLMKFPGEEETHFLAGRFRVYKSRIRFFHLLSMLFLVYTILDHFHLSGVIKTSRFNHYNLSRECPVAQPGEPMSHDNHDHLDEFHITLKAISIGVSFVGVCITFLQRWYTINVHRMYFHFSYLSVAISTWMYQCIILFLNTAPSSVFLNANQATCEWNNNAFHCCSSSHPTCGNLSYVPSQFNVHCDSSCETSIDKLCLLRCWYDHRVPSSFFRQINLYIIFCNFLLFNFFCVPFRNVFILAVPILISISLLHMLYPAGAKPRGPNQTVMFVFLSMIICGYVGFTMETGERDTVANKKQSLIEKFIADKYLYQMLPTAVVMRLKDGQVGIVDEFKDVSLLFSDIVNFTKLASKIPAGHVVKILCYLFERFDRKTQEHKVFKVQTIGDAYVICSGLPYKDLGYNASDETRKIIAGLRSGDVDKSINSDLYQLPRRKSHVIDSNGVVPAETHINEVHSPLNHTKALVNMAIDMINTVGCLEHPVTKNTMEMRIGLHTGNIAAGVIGAKTLRYDMWGKDVGIANSMEAHGLAMHICVSETTKAVLEVDDSYEFELHTKVKLKAGGEIQSYRLTKPLYNLPQERITVEKLLEESDNFDIENAPSAPNLFEIHQEPKTKHTMTEAAAFQA